ncbi:hypothetical protein HHX47_DHR3001101 [Lentinula edodes]|nr:hypothetical protein HHX47_DHR3001101 [Lentinula edodes]
MNKFYNLRSASGKRARTVEQSDSEEDAPRPEKRPRISGNASKSPKKNKRVKVPSKFRRVHGKFALLQPLVTSFPLEIVYEIFCHLNPPDILSLARTSKKLREILMSKSSENIWRAARENVEGGLPPLPSDLNEPQFAHLIFDLYCHVCNQPWRCDNVLWRFRLRCCRNCEKSFPLYKWNDLYAILYPFISFDILPKEKVKGISGRNCEDMVYDGQVALKFKAQYVSFQSDEERLAWVTRKRNERKEIEQHARQSEAWHQAKLDQRSRELSELRDQRLQAYEFYYS